MIKYIFVRSKADCYQHGTKKKQKDKGQTKNETRYDQKAAWIIVLGEKESIRLEGFVKRV